MRSIGIALATALVGLTAGVASAQQTQTGQMTLQMTGGSFVVSSANSAATDNGSVVSNSSLQGIALTGKQSDSLAKLDAVRVQAIAAADAQHTAALRALLTDAQRAKFDENEANSKAQADVVKKANGQVSGQPVKIQFQMAPGSMMPANK